MEFCIISPAAGLQKYSTLSRRHLVLSHVTNPIYRQFYKQRRDAGDTIILDNGAYEGAMDEASLLDAVGFYNPHVIIAPDILLGEAQESYNLAEQFINTWRSRCQAQWMFVPQAPAGRYDQFAIYLKFALDNLKPEWVGLPRVLATDIAPNNPNIRAIVCSTIKQYHPHTSVHALGMVDGDFSELPLLERSGCDSIDSSCAVWRGWNGFSLDYPADREKWAQYGKPCDFDADPHTLSAAKLRMIHHNLSLVGVEGATHGGTI